jgi:hypothetical protein
MSTALLEAPPAQRHISNQQRRLAQNRASFNPPHAFVPFPPITPNRYTHATRITINPETKATNLFRRQRISPILDSAVMSQLKNFEPH